MSIFRRRRGHPLLSAASPYLDGIESSTIFDLDSRITESYGGTGQTWANLVASPADSSSQTDHDRTLGADDSSSTDDPSFVGTAGDSAAYFAHDGGDWFNGTVLTDFMKDIHKDADDFWFSVRVWVGSSGASLFIANQTLNTVPGISINLTKIFGIAWGLVLNQRGDTGTSSLLQSTDADITEDAYNTLIYTYSASTNTFNVYVNGTKYSFPLTMNASTTDGDANRFQRTVANTFVTNGTRSVQFGGGNSFLSDTAAADIKTFIEAR